MHSFSYAALRGGKRTMCCASTIFGEDDVTIVLDKAALRERAIKCTERVLGSTRLSDAGLLKPHRTYSRVVIVIFFQKISYDLRHLWLIIWSSRSVKITWGVADGNM